jgi:DNA-binding response OmpR family regulator/predicted Ser/Thr protein kinase
MDTRTDILLINRDGDFLEAMAGFLRTAGYTVHTAMEMRGSLFVLSVQPVGLIVCDNVLQDISGYDFLRFLKNDPLRESIPFVFFVPINDQGRAFKAFELGAADFLVYPLEVEDFVARIREIMNRYVGELLAPAPSQAKGPPPPLPAPAAARETKPDSDERRQNSRKHPLPEFRIDLSRDGIIWMPGQIKNFCHDGLLLETALLGKPGVTLSVRFALPEGAKTARGKIKHVALDDYERPVGIGITFEGDQEWNETFGFLNQLVTSAADYRSPKKAAAEAHQGTSTVSRTMVLLPEQEGPSASVENLLALAEPEEEEVTFDTRFYHSLVGKQLNGYRAMCFIGAGTMGGVFKGWDSALEREVALKVISYELASQENFREMFVKEARLISKLNHPNIAHIYSIGSNEDILYFAMEFIQGETLADIVKRQHNLNTLKGLEYFITVCQTLDFVRQQSIIHRDIKPANIIINDKGILKVVDFGVAKRVDVTTEEAEQGIVGSPLYIAPECILGKAVDHRSDIYSLGASFYHVFTGTPPFDGTNVKEVLLQHLKAPLVSPRERNPKVSPLLSKILEKMLAKTPEERYQQYADVIRELQAFRAKVLAAKSQKGATLRPAGVAAK